MGRRKYLPGGIVHEFFSEWPCGDDWYIEEEGEGLLDEEGEVIVDIDGKYNVDELGVLYWQGRGDPPIEAPFRGERYLAVDLYILWWEKKRTEETFLVTVSKDQIDVLKQIAAEHGWKVK
jgi:hypothetical protein